MTILTNDKTTYYDDLVASRAINSKPCRVDMTKRLPNSYPTEALALLQELANLDDDDFKALSDFQGKIKC